VLRTDWCFTGGKSSVNEANSAWISAAGRESSICGHAATFCGFPSVNEREWESEQMLTVQSRVARIVVDPCVCAGRHIRGPFIPPRALLSLRVELATFFRKRCSSHFRCAVERGPDFSEYFVVRHQGGLESTCRHCHTPIDIGENPAIGGRLSYTLRCHCCRSFGRHHWR
jgi:hypothetical protein